MLKALFSRRGISLMALFIFSFSMRFMLISKGPFHLDALDLVVTAQKTLDTRMLHYEHGTGYPLTVLCASFMMIIFKFFGITDSVFCVNFMSVLAGSVSVILLFFVVEKLFDPLTPPLSREAQGFSEGPLIGCPKGGKKRIGGEGFHSHRAFFSALLLSCFMPHLAISTFGKSLTLSICLGLASAYYMLVYSRTNKHRFLIYSAVFLGFCAAARLSDILVCLPIIFLYFSVGKINYERLKSFIVFMIVFILTGLIYYLPMLLDRGFEQFTYVLQHENEARFMGVFSRVFKHNLIRMIKIFDVSGVILIAVGFVCMIIRKHYRQVIFLLSWFFPLFVFYAGISSCGPRYLVIAWIPLLIAQGYFLGGFRGRKGLAVLILVLLMNIVNFSRYVPALAFRHFYSLQEEFARWIGEKTPSNAVIVAVDEGAFIQYYGNRQFLGRPVFEKKSQVDDFFQQLNDLLAQGRDLYIISSAFGAYDDTKTFKKRLFKNYSMLFIGRKVNEDWHHSLLQPYFFNESFFKIEKKYERDI